ncbi:MAG: hypothetical protein NVS3B17_08240 [Vulcanimicrobiaceae bacterium]
MKRATATYAASAGIAASANEASSRARAFATLVGQLALLWAIGAIANAIVSRTHLPIPGNAVAMLGTFALLSANVVRLEHVDRAATFLVRHLTVFFVPYAVGIAALWGTIAPHALQSLFVLVTSALLGVAATGWTAQRLRRHA